MIKKCLIFLWCSAASLSAFAGAKSCPFPGWDMNANQFTINFNEARAKLDIRGTMWDVLIKSTLPLSTDTIQDILGSSAVPIIGSEQNGHTYCAYQSMKPDIIFTATSTFF